MGIFKLLPPFYFLSKVFIDSQLYMYGVVITNKFNDTLLRILDEEVAKERLNKQATIRGAIKDKKTTKNNNLILIIRYLNNEKAVLINKNRKELFDLANKLNINDEVFTRGDKGVNIIFCDKLDLIKKADFF